MKPFVDTSEVEVPTALIDQVLGQEDACAIIRQAAMQRRHVLLIGEPGTGKSLLGQAMAELTKVDNPEDVLIFPGSQDRNRPEIRRMERARHPALAEEKYLSDVPEEPLPKPSPDRAGSSAATVAQASS